MFCLQYMYNIGAEYRSLLLDLSAVKRRPIASVTRLLSVLALWQSVPLGCFLQLWKLNFFKNSFGIHSSWISLWKNNNKKHYKPYYCKSSKRITFHHAKNKLNLPKLFLVQIGYCVNNLFGLLFFNKEKTTAWQNIWKH